MTIKDWIYLGITVASYIIAISASIYAKNKSKINKATAVGKTLDAVGQLASFAVHETERMDLENDQKRAAAVQIINQGLSWFGIKDVTPNTVNGAIEKAVNAMHLANSDDQSVEPIQPEIVPNVPAKNLVQPTVVNATEIQTKDVAGSTKIPDKSEQQNVANSESVVNQEQNQNLPGQNVKENATSEVVKNG